MAALILTVGGQIIGGAIGGPIGAAIGGALGGAVASSLFPQRVSGPRLGDLRVSGTEYGQPIPWVTCSPRISGQIVWASAKRETANTQSAGKGGGPEVTTYTYDVDLVIMLSENPIGGVSRIWSNGDLVYNGAVTRSGIWGGLTVYTGDDSQLPDPVYEAGVGAGNAPAYRGRGYVVIQALQLGQSGQLPNLTFEIGGVDTSGYILQVPLNDDILALDLINPPEAPLQLRGAYAFVSNGLNFPVSTAAPSGLTGAAELVYKSADNSGKFNVGGYSGKRYLQFQYAIGGTTGSGTDSNINVGFVDFNNTTNNYLRFILRYQGGSLNFVAANGGIGSLAGFSYANFPSEGTVTVKFESADPANVDVFVNNTFMGTVTNFVPTTATILNFNSQRSDPLPATGPYVTSFRLSNVIFGEGDPPTFGRFTKNVSDVAADLLHRSGFEISDYDVSGIDSYDKPVRALAVGQVSTSRAIVEQLQGAFFFEASKSDKVYLRARSSSPVASIPFADLRCVNDPDSQEEPLSLVKSNDLEIPSQVSLTYANIAADYNNATEYSFRVNQPQDSVEPVQTALGMLPEEAKGVVDAILVDKTAGQTKTSVKVGLKYAYIEPGDVLSLTNDDGRIYRMRVSSKKDNLTSIELELVLDDIGAIDFSAITSDDYILTDDVRQIAPTLWEVMDIPLLRDADNENGYYVAIAPDRDDGTEIWDGAVFVRKWTTGDFENRFISGDACVLGNCQTTLGNWTGGNVFDESNSVTVRVTGELASTTRANMLNDVTINICLIGNELVRFRLAEFIQSIDGENEYKLTGLLRGQRGTEQYQTGHTASERFVLLNTLIRNVIDQNTQIDLASEVKAVTLNLALSDVTAEAFTNTAVRLKPFSVVQLRALSDGSDLEITWNRRTRLAYRYGGTVGTSVPLGESAEAYRVRIYDGSTLVRTENVSTTVYTYAAADIASDGFSSGDTATIEVVQLSEIVGEGFPAEVNGVIP